MNNNIIIINQKSDEIFDVREDLKILRNKYNLILLENEKINENKHKTIQNNINEFKIKYNLIN